MAAAGGGRRAVAASGSRWRAAGGGGKRQPVAGGGRWQQAAAGGGRRAVAGGHRTGAAPLHHAVREAQAHGLNPVLEVLSAAPAVAFYEQLGWRPLGSLDRQRGPARRDPM